MSQTQGASRKKSSKAWSFPLGIVVIWLSLWALHDFCDGYTDSIMTQQVIRGAGQGIVSAQVVDGQPAGPVCARLLGAITMTGGAGVLILLGAWAVSARFSSRRSRVLSAVLGFIGRLIALGTLGAGLLVIVLYNRF